MRGNRLVVIVGGMVIVLLVLAFDRRAIGAAQAQARPEDPVKTLVGRLDLERYKATIKGLTQFGDRLQGTDRNKAASRLDRSATPSYGCAPERLRYTSCCRRPRRRTARLRLSLARSPAAKCETELVVRRLRGMTSPTFRSRPCEHRSGCPAGSCAAGVERAAGTASRSARGGLLHQGRHDAPRRDVHRRRSHGRPGARRGRRRRWVRHGVGDGIGAYLQQRRRADGQVDSLRALEQRRGRV